MFRARGTRFLACRRTLAAAAVALAWPLPAVAAPARAEAVRIPNVSVGHNGRLTDSAWQAATPVADFVQRDPHEGAQPSQPTEFRVAYDSTTLFVQVHALDREPDKIVSYLTRRDDQSPCDWIRVFIDSYHDRRTAFEFAVNPSGVKQDRYWFNDTNNDDSWDAVWDVSVARDRSGWSAEFRIPLSQLRFSGAPPPALGFAIVREIGRLNEISSWPLLARSANGYVSSFGELDGLSLTTEPKRLEVVPYTVADIKRQPGLGNPLEPPSAAGMAVGMDLKYRMKSGLMLTATINPDFGQVEADPAVVNLSAFETFFPERRPFFVEGSGNFAFDADCYDGCNTMFYSRRIGRAPQGTGNLPSGADVFVDAPAQTTIVGAAKLTGRVGGYSIGVMHAVTKEAFADILQGPIRSQMPVEPFTNYTVARVRREFANQSYVGFIATGTDRQLDSHLSFLPAHAYAGGADFDWRFLKRYSLTGFWETSRVAGSAESIADVQQNSRHYFQRPDNTGVTFDPARTSLAGDSGAIAISKIGGSRVHFNSNFVFRSPGFDTSNLGFQQRADVREMGNWLQIRSDLPNRWFRSRAINFNYWGNWNSEGDRLSKGGNVNGWMNFANNWNANGGIGFQQVGYDDRAARGGPSVRTEGFDQAWYSISTDNRRRVQVGFDGNLGSDGHGSWYRNFGPNVTLRPVPAVMTSIGVRINRNVADSQWVANLTDSSNHYVFAHLDQTTVSLTGRLNYTMTPTLSLQLYAEPFVSGGAYSRFKELAQPRSTDYAGRYAPFDYSYDANGNPDFNVKSFRSTNVLRWEYRPGSTLFIVWQQARENDAVAGPFRFSRDASDIFAAPPRNTFLVKLAYWLNY